MLKTKYIQLILVNLKLSMTHQPDGIRSWEGLIED